MQVFLQMHQNQNMAVALNSYSSNDEFPQKNRIKILTSLFTLIIIHKRAQNN